MSRLIDAEILAFDIKMKRDYLDTSGTVGRGEYIALNKALVMIDEQPTIDAVEVVRCKDCKWWVKQDVGGVCQLNFLLATSDNWFCADGVKGEQE